MQRQNELAVSDPHQMQGVLRTQSKLAAGFHEALRGAAARQRYTAPLPKKPKGRPQ
jgi:hypothetical protein